MTLYSDEAIVLRTHKLGEADRIVTLLTRHRGKVRAVARGVRRTSSKFGARLEPFSHVSLQLATGRTLDVVTQAVTINPFGATITSDYARYTTATVLLETADRLIDEGEAATQQHLLLVGALRAVSSGTREPSLVLDSYLVRSLAIAGYAPSFTDCVSCGTEGPHRAFSPASGGIMCSGCRPPAAAMLHPSTVEFLGGLLAGDWQLVERLATDEPRGRREASGVIAAFTTWHLERGLRSLPLVDLRPA